MQNTMLKSGDRLWNGAIVSAHLADAYNAATARIMAFEAEDRTVPESLINGRHNLIANVSKEV